MYGSFIMPTPNWLRLHHLWCDRRGDGGRLCVRLVCPSARLTRAEQVPGESVYGEKRISVDDALQHPYLASLHDINTEPTSDQEFDCDFEGLNLDRHELMDLVYQEVEKFHPSLS